jgi:hypothetical protein
MIAKNKSKTCPEYDQSRRESDASATARGVSPLHQRDICRVRNSFGRRLKIFA